MSLRRIAIGGTTVSTSAIVAVLSIFCFSTAMAQDSAAAKTYDVEDAYSLLLPQEGSCSFAKGTLVAQEEQEERGDGVNRGDGVKDTAVYAMRDSGRSYSIQRCHRRL